MILLRLIELLGHGNPFVSNVAYEEVTFYGDWYQHSTNMLSHSFKGYAHTIPLLQCGYLNLTGQL